LARHIERHVATTWAVVEVVEDMAMDVYHVFS